MTSVRDEPLPGAGPATRDLEETNTATQRGEAARAGDDAQMDVVAPAQAIGRYMVLSQVGVGGMGQVYAAYDPKLDRRVALKLLHTRGTAGERERLVLEAKALARLSHPNVVTVHEVDEHEGRVLLAMEFVEGVTLKRWMRQHPLRVEGRVLEALQVLLQAGRGLVAAHEAGLVHRDFKPANVLVGQDGRVRVADFGLARVLEDTTRETGAEVSVAASGVTCHGEVMGTPAYMAPEQSGGKSVDARTDQFSFCVTAWEVLFAQRPVVGERLVKPEGVVVPQGVEVALRKGLSTRPGGRYSGMEDVLAAFVFAVDELRGRVQPVRGRPILRAVGVVAVLAGLGFGGKWLNDARVEAACSTQGDAIDLVWNAQSREAVRAGLLASEMSYAQDVADRVMPWVDRRALRWREDATEVCLNEGLRGTWDEEFLNRAQWCLEERQWEFETLIRELTTAGEMDVQHAIELAAGLSRSAVCADHRALEGMGAPPAKAMRAEVGELRRELATASYLRRVARYEDGLALAQTVRERAQTLGWVPLEVAAGLEETRVLERRSEYARAETVGSATYMLAAMSGLWGEAASTATELAYILEKQDRYSGGLTWAKHARVAIAHGGDPLGFLESRRLYVLATLARSRAEFDNAKALHLEAFESARVAFGAGHPALSSYIAGLGKSHQAMAEYEEAKTFLEEALTTGIEALGGKHPQVAVSLTDLGNLHLYTGEYRQARKLYRRALEIELETLGPNHLHVAYSLDNLGIIANLLGSSEEAKELIRRALAIEENRAHPLPLDVAGSLTNLGAVHRSLGEHAQAEAVEKRALAIKTEVLGSGHPTTAAAMSNLAYTLHMLGKSADAAALHERAMVVNEELLGAEDPSIARALGNLGVIYNAIGEYEKAMAAFERSIHIREKTLGPDNHALGYPLTGLADTLFHLKQYPVAIEHLERAHTLRASPDVPAGLLAETDFLLARALWDALPPHRDRARAIELGTQARSKYSEAGQKEDYAKVGAWLDETGAFKKATVSP